MGDSPGFAESKERLRADLRDLMKLQTEIKKMENLRNEQTAKKRRCFIFSMGSWNCS